MIDKIIAVCYSGFGLTVYAASKEDAEILANDATHDKELNDIFGCQAMVTTRGKEVMISPLKPAFDTSVRAGMMCLKLIENNEKIKLISWAESVRYH